MKKVFALVLSALIALTAATGCGGSGSASSAASSAAPASSSQAASSAASSAAGGAKTQLVFWHYWANATYDSMVKLVNSYNQKSDALATVKEQYLPRNELMKKYTLGVVSNDLPDLAMVDNPDAATYAAMGMYVDLSDRLSKWQYNKYLKGPLASGAYNSKQYTLPTRSNCVAVWTNDAMMKAAGVTTMPTTWDEFTAACEKLKATNSKVYPFAFCAVKTEEGTFQFIPFLYSAGGNINDVGSEAGIKALTYVTNLVKKGYVSADCINWTQNDVEKQFAAGNCAMMLNGCWHIANMKKDAPDLKYTIILLPKDKEYASCMGGENIGITKKCANVDAGWDFLSYFCQNDNSVQFNKENATISPHSDVTAEQLYPGDAVMKMFSEQLSYAVPRGPSPKWGELSTAVQEAIQASLTGTKTPEQAAKDAGTKIASINASLK